MTESGTYKTLPESLLGPLDSNNGVGNWLRYDPIYVSIRDARREEDDGMLRQSWEAELKHANWQDVERLCTDVLVTKSKDLQIITWLLEARLKLYGIDTFSKDTSVLAKFIKSFWQDCYPQKTDDPEQEFRVHILEAFLRSTSEAIVVESFKELSPFFSQPPNLAKCYEVDNLEKMAKRGGEAANALQKAISNGLVSMERIRNALSEVGKEKGEKKVAILETCTQNLKGIEEFVNEQIGKESPSFDELVNHLNEIKGLYRLCQKVAPTNTVNQSIQGSPGLSTVEEDPLKNQKEKDSKPKIIEDRAGVYNAIRQLGDFLLTLEPHSPSPALLRLVGGWENKTLSQILTDLQSSQPETKSLLDLLARATQQEKQQATQTQQSGNNPLGSTDTSQLSSLIPG